MTLYPAIDILEGSAVRLVKGDFEAKKVYDEDPLDAARGWVQTGAKYLHVVDLDGAKTGAPVNLEHLRRIAGELGVPVQYGGGLRSARAVGDALAAGATRVILGTAAFTQAGLLEQVLGEHGKKRILVSVDVRGGHVTTAGWTETTEIATEAVIESLAERGASDLVFTNVDRDGMLEGPDLEEVRRVLQAGFRLAAWGRSFRPLICSRGQGQGSCTRTATACWCRAETSGIRERFVTSNKNDSS